MIVNIGCGLDARLQRLGDVAQTCHFYSLDIPESMALREKLLPALAHETYFSCSMLDSAWLDLLAKNYPDTAILFIVEGVMMYF